MFIINYVQFASSLVFHPRVFPVSLSSVKGAVCFDLSV